MGRHATGDVFGAFEQAGVELGAATRDETGDAGHGRVATAG